MTKYIDAEKLIAEIERHINHYKSSNRDNFKNGELYICQELLFFIKSLQQEQQEVDLEEEMDRFFEEMPVHEHENIFEDTYHMIARHFYKLGKNSK